MQGTVSRRILVTGGAGTIGTALVAELTRRGHSVVSCDLAHGEHEQGFALRTDVLCPRYVRCDVGEFRQIERVIETMGPFDLIYHAAAEFGRWNGEDFTEQLWKTNAVGTKNIIRLQERLGFELVHFSSSEVYGDYPDVMAEDVMETTPIRQMNDYAMSKWVNEMQIANSREAHGTRSVVVRIFNTYGPGEFYSPYRSVNCRFTYCALAGLPFVVFRGYGRTSTYLADSVSTIANIAERFVPGAVYNIGGDQYHTIEELAALVLEATGADPSLAEYRDSEVLTTQYKRVDNTRAVADLGHVSTVTLAEGVSRTVAWMRDIYGFKGAR